jgi:HSP20 family protein
MAENREQREIKNERSSQDADRTPATGGRRGPTSISTRDPFTTLPALAGSPFGIMRRFSDEMDRLFQDFGFGRAWPEQSALGGSFASTMWTPQIEMFERDNRLVVRADLPGLKREDINLEIREDELVLSGERRDERKEEREGFYRSECSYGSFNRRLPLPEGVNADTAKASFQNGVLEITMETAPRPASRSRRIDIEERSAGAQPQSQKIG